MLPPSILWIGVKKMGMSGIIFNIQRFSIHDGPGIRTIVFLKGCPLNCIWCANPESQNKKKQVMYSKKECRMCGICQKVCPNGAIYIEKYKGVVIDREKCMVCGTCIEECIPMALKIVGKELSVEEIKKEVMKDSSFFRRDGGITLSGGEAMAQKDFAAKLLKEFHDLCIHTAVETCGQVEYETIEAILPYCDLFLYDIKEMNSLKHKEFIGMGNEKILENLLKLGKTDAKIWIRMPIIAGYNDNPKEVCTVADIARQIRNLERIELLPYHNLGVSKYERLGKTYELDREMPPPTQERLYALKKVIEQELQGRDVEVIVGK